MAEEFHTPMNHDMISGCGFASLVSSSAVQDLNPDRTHFNTVSVFYNISTKVHIIKSLMVLFFKETIRWDVNSNAQLSCRRTLGASKELMGLLSS